ncbi:cysteine hydrolase family protein [Hoeflea prorocentri]|uniref:Cysteine hydrolase n=1 Tax=Hoeflea prorocentri TaxID=1922333 RepID=A0A9X3UQQ1_9HYPH|nr:isochorismatase family cysteine hydrolase [Hoeflea prorocentri]MCY6383466.1 cysteine hydrolase [Hoeflea prorocentri]MDA5401266.1 cysteine hydrolase [Hoeflea prorocentri]
MMKDCLAIIDLQNDYLASWDPDETQSLVSGVNKLVSCFRSLCLPIVWIKTEFRQDLTDAFLEMRDKNVRLVIENSPGAELHPKLDWLDGDETVTKKRYSAFFRTNLDDFLQDNDVERLVLCGINTHACVRMTAIDAYQRDLRVVLAEDCIGSHDRRHSKISLDYLNGKMASLTGSKDIVSSLTKEFNR